MNRTCELLGEQWPGSSNVTHSNETIDLIDEETNMLGDTYNLLRRIRMVFPNAVNDPTDPQTMSYYVCNDCIDRMEWCILLGWSWPGFEDYVISHSKERINVDDRVECSQEISEEIYYRLDLIFPRDRVVGHMEPCRICLYCLDRILSYSFPPREEPQSESDWDSDENSHDASEVER